MYCDTVHSDEISRIIANFPNNKSPGLDGITPKLLKEISTDVIRPLTSIFNLSFTIGVVSDYLKQFKVLPLYTKGNRDNPGNYCSLTVDFLFLRLLFPCAAAWRNKDVYIDQFHY